MLFVCKWLHAFGHVSRKGDIGMSDDTDPVRSELRGAMPERPEQAITASAAFTGLVQLRNTEAQLRWNGFQAAVALNVAGGAGLLLFLRANSTNVGLFLGLIACAVAVFFNFIHHKILGRDGKFMELWSKKLVELEQANGIDGGVQVFSSVRYLSLRDRSPTIQEVLRFCVVICMILWVAGSAWLAWLWIRGDYIHG